MSFVVESYLKIIHVKFLNKIGVALWEMTCRFKNILSKRPSCVAIFGRWYGHMAITLPKRTVLGMGVINMQI